MSEHCNIISAKAKTRVGMIFRAFSSTNPALLTKAFITFVRPLLENCTTVWSPHLAKNINRIESVQRYFTWRVFRRCGLGHPGYKNRCAYLKLDTLELRRLRFDLSMCFKIVKGLVNLDFNDFFVFNENCTRGNCKKLRVPRCRKDVRKFFFGNRVVKVWNILHNDVVNSSSVDSFLHKIESIDLSDFISI